MNKPTDTTLRNRTGIKASPVDSKKSVEGAALGTPDHLVRTEAAALTAERLAYSSEAPPVGTMPPPASVKGAIKSGAAILKGEHANVFLDKLGARLAFERTGTRLYEALLIKHEAANVHEEGPSREELIRIRDQELAHAVMLARCIEELGADPTAVTPAADIQGVAGSGLVQVLGDPRTTLTEALETILIAELADVDSWEILVDLAEGLGHDQMAEQFQLALAQEEEHLVNVRSWVTTAVLGQAGVDVSAEEDEEDDDEVIEAEIDEEEGELHPPPTTRT